MNKREKKTYIKPTINVVEIHGEELLALSIQQEMLLQPCEGDLAVESTYWKGDYSVLFR